MRGANGPILASLGTVLIDSFDRPPRPCIDCMTLPDEPSSAHPPPPPPAPRSANNAPSFSALLDAIPRSPRVLRSGPSSPALSDSASSSSAFCTTAPAAGHSIADRRGITSPPAALTVTSIQPNSGAGASSSHVNLSPTSTIGTRLSGARTPQLDFGDSGSETSAPPENSYDVLGGGALYALVGARMWLPAEELRTLVDRKGKGRALPDPEPEGSENGDVDEASEEDDLPRELEEQLEAFGEQIWVWNRTTETRMVRARIRYDGDVRLFQQVVKAPKRTLASLRNTPVFGAEYLHISPPASPQDVCDLLDELQRHNSQAEARTDSGETAWYPKIVFEPTPPSCHPEQRPWLERCLSGLTVLSPNHEELLSIYGEPSMALDDPAFPLKLEGIISHILSIGIGPDGQGVVVVRCGKMGSCVGTRQRGMRWFPAGFASDEEYRVKDVTGAGNAFLGGYVAGLSLTNGDPYEAALYATMSSSFTIEQFGLPDLQRMPDGSEEWNGELPSDRLDRFRRRLLAAVDVDAP